MTLVDSRPDPGVARPFAFPTIVRTTVGGGLVVAAHMPGQRLATASLLLDAGGTRHIGTWVHLDRPRWRRHYGSHWASVNDLKHRLDPAGVLNPGLIDFEPRQNRVPHPKKGAEPGSVA